MKVCHVAYTYYPFDVRVHKEAAALGAAGHEVEVIVMQAVGESREEIVDGIAVYRIPMPIVRGGTVRYVFQYALFLFLASALLVRLHLRRPFAIIHVHSLPDFQIFCAVPEKALGARLVLDLHEAMPEILAARFRLSLRSRRVGVARVLEWVSCALADQVIVVNETIGELLRSRGVAASKILVIANSPDLRPFDSKTSSEKTGGPRIVYAGGINEERDLRTLVRACGRLQKAHPHDLLFYGSGNERFLRELTDLAVEEGFGSRFLTPGRVPPKEVLSLLHRSLVGPVTYERNPLTELALPNKVFEYAAAGIPLVVADLPALRRVFGEAALYYAPGDAEDLAEKMSHLIENRSMALALVARAKMVLNKYSWKEMETRLLSLYSKEMAGGAQ